MAGGVAARCRCQGWEWIGAEEQLGELLDSVKRQGEWELMRFVEVGGGTGGGSRRGI